MQVTVEDGVPVAYWIAESADSIMRGVDLDGNGTIAGEGEVTVFRDSGALDGESWPQELVVTDDGAVWWAAALVIANPQNGISRLEDLNGDGDAADEGEQVVLVDGTGQHPIQYDLGTTMIDAWGLESLAAAGNGVIAYCELTSDAVFRFEDLNGDGDVTDADESVLLLNVSGVDPELPVNPDFQDGTLKSLKLQSGSSVRLTYLATALEDGERAFYFATESIGVSPSPSNTNVDGKGTNFLIYRGVDGNGDRDVNDAGEVKLWLDGSYTDGSPAMLTVRGFEALDGGDVFALEIKPFPVLFPGDDGNVWLHRFRDLNGDGDAMDAGELTQGVFDLQVHGVSPFFPNPPTFGNVMADPFDLAISPPFLFEPAYTLSGGGCSLPSGSAPTLAGSGSGLQGTDFSFELLGALPGAAGVWSVGTSTTTWLSLPLPLDLTPFGYTGCTLYHDAVSLFAVPTDGVGDAELTLTLPTGPGLAGLRLPTQWFVFGLGGEVQMTGLGSLLLK